MLKELVFEKLKESMKNKDALSKGVLTLLKAGIDSAEKEKGSILTKEEEIAVLNKELKQTKQALEGAQKANREDLIEKENQKIALIVSFLPKQMSKEEAKEELIKNGISKGENMGSAMKIAKELLNGKIDNGSISQIVKELIS